MSGCRGEQSDPSETEARLDGILRELVTKREFSNLSTDQALLYLVERLADGLNVARIGVWELVDNGSTLHSLLMWDRVGGPQFNGLRLNSDDAETYIDAVKGDFVLKINDAMNDPRCAELTREYLPKNNVRAMLDCPIRTFGGLAGVVCIEQTGAPRDWTVAEVNFALAVTGLISLTMEHDQRLKAERSARAHEDRLRDYTSLATDWYWDTDEDFRMQRVYGNDARDGQTPDSFVEKILWEIDHLSPILRSWDWLKDRVRQRKRIYDFVVASTDPYGMAHYAELAGFPKYAEDGTFIGYWGTAKDVTARMRREMELAQSEQRYRSAARIGGLGSWIWNEIENRCSYCSPEFAKIYGVSVEHLLERLSSVDGDLSWIHPDDRDHYAKVIREAVRDQTGYETIVRIVRDDGKVRTLHENTEAVFDSAGRFVATSGVVQDVTERIELDARLQRQEAQLDSIVANIPGALYRVKDDANFTPLYRSPGFARQFLYGDDCGEEGETTALTLRPEDRARIDVTLRESTAEGTPYEMEYPVLLADGSERWVSDRGRPVQALDGTIEFEGIMLDVTERHAAEQALAHSQRLEAIGQLTGGIAHDFNNVLAVILGNLDLLQSEENIAGQRELIDNAIAAVNRGAELNRNMLAFARKSQLKLEPLDFAELIESAGAWIGRTLPETISLKTTFPADLWKISGDASSTESVLLNLILNARDAMPGGGELTINAGNVILTEDEHDDANELIPKGRYVVLTVSDTGAGIAEEVIERIFEPFYTTKPIGSGSGLGLSMVMGYMKQAGGHVRVESAVGIGTTFSLYFKAALGFVERQNNDDLPTNRPANKSARILIVEDDEAVLTVMVKTLIRAGYQVTSATSGQEAVTLFEADPSFDLLITDVVMPGPIQGPMLVQSLRKTHPELPVIIISGYTDENTLSPDFLEQDVIRLQKPVNRQDMMAAIEKVLAAS